MPVLVAPRGETVEVSYPKWLVECYSPSYVVEVDTGVIHMGGEPYPGPYEVIPSEETQTLQTRLKGMAQDIVVAPIPPNYGKITRVGVNIIVS